MRTRRFSVTDDQYRIIAQQCARCALALLVQQGILHLPTSELLAVLSWRDPRQPTAGDFPDPIQR